MRVADTHHPLLNHDVRLLITLSFVRRQRKLELIEICRSTVKRLRSTVLVDGNAGSNPAYALTEKESIRLKSLVEGIHLGRRQRIFFRPNTISQLACVVRQNLKLESNHLRN